MAHQIFAICASLLLVCCLAFAQEYVPDEMIELVDITGWGRNSEQIRIEPWLSNSATKFLIEVYKELSEDDEEALPEYFSYLHKTRYKRSLPDETLITSFDRREIELCNNIITFASRPPRFNTNSALSGDMFLNFNLNDIPDDLELTRGVLRIYQNPQLGVYGSGVAAEKQTFKVSLYQPSGDYMLYISSTNTTTDFRGWLELNATSLLNNWIRFRTFQQTLFGNQLLVGVALHKPHAETGNMQVQQIAAADIGLVPAHVQREMLGVQPFLIGYFNGPDLLTKVQANTDHTRRERQSDFLRHQRPLFGEHTTFEQAAKGEAKPCERYSFTLDFSFLGIENSVIAPKTFATYFCYGECNFPLGTPMSNATNHAIVQTLMHLSRPSLPKPACVPTKLSPISILHSINEDNANLIRFSQIVAKECGCR
ncbi:protein screw [Anastrepha obliqua]|uniref:protein screw n=1 Tax=Anastrepha obliqua TaxID=95512 RepID=UPI002409899B|nr:protein screw [Anastrepha obliqua]XP_054729571.1 protein screw [Anastrepha obliqua]